MEYLLAKALPSLIAAIAYMVVGTVWYSPGVFGSAWQKLAIPGGKVTDEMKKGMGLAYLGSFIGALIAACILWKLLFILGADSVAEGAQYALWLGIGFVAVPLLMDSLFLKKSLALYGITAGYHVVSLVVMGAILGGWQW